MLETLTATPSIRYIDLDIPEETPQAQFRSLFALAHAEALAVEKRLKRQ
jgi:hypothetical protein